VLITRMRKTFVTLLVLAVAVVAYSAWPFYELFKLVRAVQARDVATVSRRVDFTALSRSLSEQIVRSYARISGTPMSPLTQQMVFSVGAGLAEPVVSKMVTPDAVADLIRVGWPVAVLGAKPDEFTGINFRGDAWRLYLKSEYGWDEFRLWVPVDKPQREQYRVTLKRNGLTWTLTGVLLPEPVQDRVAQELVRLTPPRR
jgi:hypothetical protein